MAVTTYSESTFRSYLYAQLSPTLVGIIGWTSASDPALQTMVDDTLLILETSDITTLTTANALAQLRAVGKYMLWRAAIQFLVTQYDVTVDGSTFKRSQLIENLMKLLGFAYDEAIAAGVPSDALPPAPGSAAMPPATVSGVAYRDPYTGTSSIYGLTRE